MDTDGLHQTTDAWVTPRIKPVYETSEEIRIPNLVALHQIVWLAVIDRLLEIIDIDIRF